MSGDSGPLSARNSKVLHLRRLSGRRRARSEHGQYVIDGPTLVVEALRAGVDLDAVYLDEAAPLDRVDLTTLVAAVEAADVRVHVLAEGVLAKISDTVTPQHVVAVANGAAMPFASFLATPPAGMVLVLAGVSDPGNAGTLVRTAEATGAAGVVFCEGSVDPLGPKTVRAAAGSGFRVPVVDGSDAAEVVGSLRDAGFRTIGTVATKGVDYTRADLAGNVAFVLGSEAHGLAPAVGAMLDVMVTIPMRGEVESLNVAVAGSVLAFEWMRGRTT